MRSLCLMALGACLLAAPLAADDTEKAKKVYDGLMSDSDLYAGEGIVSLTSFGGDKDKAKASGRERARANMVEGIRVRIVSKTTDTQSMGKDGSKEEVSSQSSSSADIELEGIQYKVLEDFPKDGQLTVIASLSKEDYLRQSEKRMTGYRPLRAFRLYGGVISGLTMEETLVSNGSPPAGQPHPLNNNGNSSSVGQPAVGLGADFFINSWTVGFGISTGNRQFYAWEARQGLYTNRNNPWSVMHLKAGYDWTPWATRLQLVVPLQAEFSYLNWDPHFATAYGVGTGLRLRYWASDRVAFDVSGLFHQGLSKNEIATRDGEPLLIGFPRQGVPFELTGPELSIGVLWNGF